MLRAQVFEFHITLLLCVFVTFCTAYNVDVVHPVIYGDPFGDRSLFGYRVQFLASKDGRTNWVLVGAPKATSRFPEHVKIKEPGRLYRCTLKLPMENIQETCLPYAVDPQGNRRGDDPSNPYYRNDYKDFGWLGGALAVQNPKQEKVAVCSPRWMNIGPGEDYRMNGACYFDITENDLPINSSFEKRIPLINRDFQVTQFERKSQYLNKYGEAGIDVHFSGEAEMVVGAPGVFNWTGTVIRYKNYESPDNGGSEQKRRKRQSSVQKYNLLTTSFTPQPQYTPELRDNQYFGSSVSSGHFQPNKTIYVAGAPRAGDLTGKVFLFEFPSREDHALRIVSEKSGTQEGEYFGAALLVTDLGNDGCDDLIVGSPMYSLPESILDSGVYSSDEGKITVFVNKKTKEGNCRLAEKQQTLYGNKAKGARFGSAIATLGDISNDNYPDVVVGAPFEDNNGAIYIYYAHAENGLTSTFVQRIPARDISPFLNLQGFGIHVAAYDIDNNGFPDVAVGSHTSGNVVVLRTRPLVRFNLRLNNPADIDRGQSSQPQTKIEACASYTSRKIPRELCAEFTLHLDVGQLIPRLRLLENGQILSNQHSFIEPLKLGEEKCFKYTAEPSGKNEDFSRPADVRFSVALRSIPSNSVGCSGSKPDTAKPGSQAWYITTAQATKRKKDEFCATCPVLDKRDKLSVETKIAFKAGCGDDKICIADLAVNYTLLEDYSVLVIGTRQMKFRARMTNYEEPAFSASLVLEVPSYVSLARAVGGPSPQEVQMAMEKGICGKKGLLPFDYGLHMMTMIDFMMDKPLTKGQKLEMEFTLDISRIPPGTPNLCIGLDTFTRSNLTLNPLYPKQTFINIPLKTYADIAIRRVTGRDQITYERPNGTDEGSTSVDFVHQYQVFKSLASPVTTVKIELNIPRIYSWGSEKIKILDLYGVKAERYGAVTKCIGEFDARLSTPQASALSGYDDEAEDAVQGRKGTLRESSPSVWDEGNRHPLDMTFAANRTSWFNCSMMMVSCSRVTCTVGAADALIDSQTEIMITLEASVKLKNIWPSLHKRDIIVVASDAYVKITDPENASQQGNDKPDYALAVTYFVPFGIAPEEKVSAGLIVLAILAGILVLGLISYGLYKAGFFVRKQPPTAGGDAVASANETIPLNPSTSASS